MSSPPPTTPTTTTTTTTTTATTEPPGTRRTADGPSCCPYTARWLRLFDSVDWIRRQIPDDCQRHLTIVVRSSLLSELFALPRLDVNRPGNLAHRCGPLCNTLYVEPRHFVSIYFTYNRADPRIGAHMAEQRAEYERRLSPLFPHVRIRLAYSFHPRIEEPLRPTLTENVPYFTSFVYRVYQRPHDESGWLSTFAWQTVLVVQPIILTWLIALLPAAVNSDPAEKSRNHVRLIDFKHRADKESLNPVPFFPLIARTALPMRFLRDLYLKTDPAASSSERQRQARDGLLRAEIGRLLATKRHVAARAATAPLLDYLHPQTFVVSAHLRDDQSVLLYMVQPSADLEQGFVVLDRYIVPPKPSMPFNPPPHDPVVARHGHGLAMGRFTGGGQPSRQRHARRYLAFLHAFSRNRGVTHPRCRYNDHNNLHAIPTPMIDYLLHHDYDVDEASAVLRSGGYSLHSLILQRLAVFKFD